MSRAVAFYSVTADMVGNWHWTQHDNTGFFMRSSKHGFATVAGALASAMRDRRQEGLDVPIHDERGRVIG